MNPTTSQTLALGTYRLYSAATYTSQVWEVAAGEVRVFTAPTGNYPAEFLGIITHERAAEIIAAGKVLRYPAPEFTPAIGNAVACELHKELGRLQFKDHYQTASDALGRLVRSLAALTAEEARTVRSYAYGQWGLTG